MPLADDGMQVQDSEMAIHSVDAFPPLYYEGPSIVNDYKVVPGVCIIPVAEAPPQAAADLKDWSPVVNLRLHSPFRIRNATFRATKQNAPPILPSPSDTGAFIFTGGNLTFNNNYVNNGQFNWTCVTQFTYVENCVSRNEDGYVLGTPAFFYPSQAEAAGATGGSPQVDSPGAIAYAGPDAKTGWTYQTMLGAGQYNIVSYFPGSFFNDQIMNAALSSNADGSGGYTPPPQYAHGYDPYHENGSGGFA